MSNKIEITRELAELIVSFRLDHENIAELRALLANQNVPQPEWITASKPVVQHQGKPVAAQVRYRALMHGLPGFGEDFGPWQYTDVARFDPDNTLYVDSIGYETQKRALYTEQPAPVAVALTQQKTPLPHSNCRQRLADEGKPYPRSSCAVCGQFSPKWCDCDALLNHTKERKA